MDYDYILTRVEEQLVLMKKAGFAPDTPLSKVKVILGKGKWKPTTKEAIEATELLYRSFHSEDELHFYDLCRAWGSLCGLEHYPELGRDERILFRSQKEAVEATILEEFGVDVKLWGNPLEYETQSY